MNKEYPQKKNYPDMRILDETDRFFIGHIFEDAFLIEKRNGEEIVHDYLFYGDPTCGLISANNDWAIIAGDHITIWKAEKKTWINRNEKGSTTRIENDELRWIHSLRTSDNQTIEILVDPWADNSAIWTLDISTLSVKKIRDFNDYKETERTDEVIW